MCAVSILVGLHGIAAGSSAVTVFINISIYASAVTWELTSVSMRYSQGGGVNTFLSRLMCCTHV